MFWGGDGGPSLIAPWEMMKTRRQCVIGALALVAVPAEYHSTFVVVLAARLRSQATNLEHDA